MRMETLAKFKNGEFKYLVCSDVAARGLDIPEMSHVFNFDVPTHAEDYIHRIGRTGRAGREGRAFTLAISTERKYLRAIEQTVGQVIPPLELDSIMPSTTELPETPAHPQSEIAKKPKHLKRPNPRDVSEKKPKRQELKSDKPLHEDRIVRGMGDHVPAFMRRDISGT